ncbi:type II secretion system protein [Thalassotalea sp. M1531]|uniref:Type II secretion system protein n=1 Tax=Thalassotalea algicola TaxID=2716224 RepID=A0A7Y0Q985_9GAMM|nr:type II secretion system protein [Thalassotalea algicola]NMP32945.1 type II secretion system protein [Thalassotalea algicola]
MPLRKGKHVGFTLIELMIVMSIVALLMGMVGPIAFNSLDKAKAKQEMLTLKVWFRKVSARAYQTGKNHTIELNGKKIFLYVENVLQPIEQTSFESLFFQPQQLKYNDKGFVDTDKLVGSYRGQPLELELSVWVNGETEIAQAH